MISLSITSIISLTTMLLTPHTIVGIAVASSISNPLIAVPLSFGLHFLGDLVPHWDFYSNTKREQRLKGWRPLAVMGDMAVGVAISMSFTLYALWILNNPLLAVSIFFSAIASVLPDILTGPSLYIEGVNSIFSFVHKVQHKCQFQAPLPWGIITQLLVILGCLLILRATIL